MIINRLRIKKFNNVSKSCDSLFKQYETLKSKGHEALALRKLIKYYNTKIKLAKIEYRINKAEKRKNKWRNFSLVAENKQEK